jgi:threonine dehydrogenase-like Zn-dependent dehydrogenase
MRAAIFKGKGSILVEDRPRPAITEPTDAIVRVVLACVCGSDLWYYRGESDHAVGSIGHEFIGVVEDIGAEVTGIARGDLVVAPFIFSDMSCAHCLHGSTISCVQGGNFGNGTIDGGQGEAVRVPGQPGTVEDLNARVREGLRRAEIMALSTVGADGPWTSPVQYHHNDAIDLAFLSLADTKHGANIRHDARVSVAISATP